MSKNPVKRLSLLSKLADLGEFGLIDLLKKNIYVSKDVITAIGDDCAVVNYSSSEYLLLTTDMLIEDIHFTRQMDPRLIGHKALACNLSDIAAMGGRPTFAVISLGLPQDLKISFVKDIYSGLNKLARTFGVSIVGGDTNKSDKIIINIALLGNCKKEQVVHRSGAKAGDIIFVSGPLGNSFKSGKHLSFTPRLKESQFLVENFKPSAMIDISDGLLADLNHIVKANQVGAMLQEENIPLNKGASLKNACMDGEDFELLFTLSGETARSLLDSKEKMFKFYPIGRITGKKNTIEFKTTEGQLVKLVAAGFKHF